MGAERLQDIIEIYRFKEDGSTYSASVVLVYDGDTAVVKGLCEAIDTEDWKEVTDHLRSNGVRYMQYTRMNTGRKRKRKIRL